MQKVIDAEKSDLFDVLAHVAYALAPLTRDERASKARVIITQHFNSKQQVFLDFVLAHYVTFGVEELDQAKLAPLLKMKYHDSIADAVADLGRPEEIARHLPVFSSICISSRLEDDMMMCVQALVVGSLPNLCRPTAT